MDTTDDKAFCDGAKWIWMPEPDDGYYPNQFMYARRVFALSSKPKTAMLYISADSLYRLSVNGRRVAYGPPLGDTYHILYDSYNITNVLRAGRNAITVVVHSLVTGMGGLICQLDVDSGSGVEACLVTDGQWRVKQATEWHRPTPPSSNFLGYSEVMDNRRVPEGVEAIDFDDGDWDSPVLMDPCRGEPTIRDVSPAARLSETVTKRRLEDAGLPHLAVTERRPVRIAGLGQIMETEHEYTPTPGQEFDVAWKMLGEFVHPLTTCSVDNAEGLTEAGGHPMVVTNRVITRLEYDKWYQMHDNMPQVDFATVILDFGTEIAARLRFDVDANEGAALDVAWGELLIDGRVHPKPHPTWGVTKANRYTLREGRQSIEAFDWQIFRYVQITFRHLTRPAKVFSIVANQVTHPFDYDRYTFSCDDPELNLAWTAWVKTTQATVIDHLVDPREKGFWNALHAPCSLLALYGDTPFLKRYIQFCLREHDERGLLYISPVAQLLGHKTGVPPLATQFSFADLATDYFWYADDQRFFEDNLYPWLKALEAFCESVTSPRGLLDVMSMRPDAPGGVATLVDWSRPRSTTNCRLNESVWWNLRWYLLLQSMAPIVDRFGLSEDADSLRARAKHLWQQMYDCFWSEQRGMYVDEVLDGQRSEEYSEYTNCLALRADLGAHGRAERIIGNLRQPPDDLIRVEHVLFINVLLGLCHAGQHGLALDIMKNRLSRYFKTGNYLLGEEWSYFGSMRYRDYFAGRIRNVAQGLETLYIPQVFYREILGIRPTEPGFKAFRVAPHLAHLHRAFGRAASPAGDIEVTVERRDASFAVEVDVPPGTRAEVVVPAGHRLRVDGKPSDIRGRKQPDEAHITVHVSAGHHRIETTSF